MQKNKFPYLLLAPVLLGVLFSSCTNSKPNQEGQSPSDNKELFAKNSALSQQQNSPDATGQSSPTDPTQQQSSPNLPSPPSLPNLTQQPGGTEVTQQPGAPTLSKPQSATAKTQQPSPAKTPGLSNILTTSNPGGLSNYADAARFLAGMKVDGTTSLVKSENSKSWQSHASFFDSAWARLEKQQLSKVKKWSSTELASLNPSAATIFYPFSGPDFLYVYSFFPNATEYVLVGLEPVGEIPALEKLTSSSEIGTNLRWLESSMSDVMQLSFFKTKNMAKDFKEAKLKGVLPVLFVFLARTNNTILDVHYIDLNKDGTVQMLPSGSKGSGKKAPIGVKIDFVSAGDSTPHSLYYFSTDLSNAGLKKDPEFETYVKSLPSPMTYLKAASYLMYQPGFSNIRNLILSQSSSLLQDDSGMPVKYFDRSKWNLKFYGSYTGPIGLFHNDYESDLRKIYQTDKTIKPLDFGIGYQYRLNQSNLMLAISK